MPETPRGIRYPKTTDDAKVPQDLQNAAEDIDDLLGAIDLADLVVPGGTGDDGKLIIVKDGAAAFAAMKGDGTIGEDGTFQIAAGAVGTTELAANAATTAKIDAEAVTLGKLAQAVAEALVPTGAILATARSAAPTGFLLCDGSAVSRTTYKALFEAISTAYGVGNGSTTFNVPDLRGRVPVGVDGAAARLTANDALGNSGGEEKHKLTVGELAKHFHYTHIWQVAGGVAGSWVINPASANEANGINTTEAGNDEAHNNMQPFQVVTYVIKI